MPNDDERDPTPVEKMLSALDELQEVVDRLAVDRHPAGRRTARDLTLVEPFSREELRSLKEPLPRP
jgi:hypothetical protein